MEWSSEQVLGVRDVLPALSRAVYMNTGTAGPLPLAAARALGDAVYRQVRQGRAGPEEWDAVREAATAARSGIADLLGSTADRIALTHHTTDGVVAAALGLPWQPGDVAVTTDAEHAAVRLALGALRLRHGVQVRTARISTAADASEAATMVAAQMRGVRARALFVSHVSYANGAVLPLRALAAAAHDAGAAVIVDGAQSVGAMPVTPGEVGADMYTVSGQKWLCGPEGTGAVWVAPGFEERLIPAAVGYAGIARGDEEGYYLPAAGAKRLEVGTVFGPGLAGLAGSLGWLADLGWEAVWARIHALAARTRERLGALAGVEVVTPAEHAGLVSFRVAGVKAEDAVVALRERGYLVRSIPGWDAVRASLGFFLLESEVDGLAEEVARLRPPAG